MALYAKIIIGFVAVALVGVALYVYFAPREGDGITCTLDAKLCPDGSYVGRVGPKCEFAACPSGTSEPGIRGTVLLGPTCPVERIPPDPKCADRPYETLVAIFRASDSAHAVVITRSGADGTFFAAVPPGDYTIGAGESNWPRCAHPGVTVAPGAIATATVSCDTGIR